MTSQIENSFMILQNVCFTQDTIQGEVTLFIHTMDYDTEFVELCSSNIRRISIIMYSLFCESLNKVQMKLIKLQSHTDFTISLFDFS